MLDRNRRAVSAHFAALDSGDFAMLDDIHDHTGRNHAPAPFDLAEWPAEGRPFGPREVRETFEWLRRSLRDLHVEIEQMLAEGDEVVAWIRMTGVEARAGDDSSVPGRRVDFHHAHRFRLREGRIVEHWAVRDDLRALLQSGRIASPR